MTLLEFQKETSRLRTRFGEKHFDAEFMKLLWREVQDMNAKRFEYACDAFIGSRPINKPPMLVDFRDVRQAEEKAKLQADTRGALDFVKRQAPEEMRQHLSKALSKEFGGVESVSDALEVARTKIRIERANK